MSWINSNIWLLKGDKEKYSLHNTGRSQFFMPFCVAFWIYCDSSEHTSSISIYSLIGSTPNDFVYHLLSLIYIAQCYTQDNATLPNLSCSHIYKYSLAYLLFIFLLQCLINVLKIKVSYISYIIYLLVRLKRQDKKVTKFLVWHVTGLEPNRTCQHFSQLCNLL